MPKQDPKSTEKYSTVEELALMRMSIRALREHMNANLDAMLDHVNRLLPPEDTNRCIKFKNFSKADWHEFLNF